MAELMTLPDLYSLPSPLEDSAMEQQAEKMLLAQSERLEHYPKLKARIDQHIEETLSQQALVDGCLKRLGAVPPH